MPPSTYGEPGVALAMGMGRGVADAVGEKEIRHAYDADIARLIAGRAPPAAAIFLASVGAASVVAGAYAPERSEVLAQTYVAYVVVCLLHLAIVWGMPRWAWPATMAASSTLGFCISSPFLRAPVPAELAVIALAIFLTAVFIAYPLGLVGQLTGSAGAVCGYLLILWAGTPTMLPAPVGLFALLTVTAMTAFGAQLAGRQRFAAHHDAVALERANAFQRHEQELSAALLRVASALSRRIDDPPALAEQLAEHTRQALRADWVILYTAAESATHFRAAAIRGTPRTVSDDVRTFGFRADNAPCLYERLETTGTVELGADPGPEAFPRTLMERWHVSSALVQSLTNKDRIIGLLCCCYTGWRGPFSEQQRRLLAAIARQAAVALDNARLMEETQAANRIKSEFVSTVSHEVRTPLNVIVGYTNLLIDGVFGLAPAAQLDPLQRIAQQSTQLLDLIQDMLDCNRIEAGQLRPIVEQFCVGDLFDSVRAGIPPTWHRNGVRLRWDPTHNDLLVRSDRLKIEAILRHLIHNALKYTEEGVVAIEAAPHSSDRHVSFTVSDTGPGIATEDLSTIFESFHRGSSASLAAGRVGLGLYIAKRLSEVLGGQIHVESHRGAGARFTLSLPLVASRARWASAR